MAGIQTSLRARVEPRLEGGPRVVLTEGSGVGSQVDLTSGLVAAIAHALWQARGGDDLTNWAEAEAVLGQLVGGGPAQSEVKPMPSRMPTPTPSSSPSQVGASGSPRRTMPRR